MNPIDAIFKGLAELVAFYYGLVPNYAIAIALLTVTVMVVLAPLTWKSTRSMIAMQAIQPEMKRIQQQYKTDRVKLNEEMMALYKEHNVNPLTSCLPQFLQLPVLFIMYRVIRGLSDQPKNWGGFKPKYITSSSKLYISLVHKHTMKSFGLDLANSASKAMHKSIGSALPFLALVAVVLVTQIISTRQMMGRNPAAAQNQQAQMMNKLMPALFGVWSYLFPAGLNVYFLISNAMRIGQQSLMYRLDPSLAAGISSPKGDGGTPKRPIDAKSAPARPVDAPPESPGSPPGPESTAKKSFFERLREAATAPARAPADKPVKDAPAGGSPGSGTGGPADGNGSQSPPDASGRGTGGGGRGNGATSQGSNGKANGSPGGARGGTGGARGASGRSSGARSGGASRNKKKRRGR